MIKSSNGDITMKKIIVKFGDVIMLNWKNSVNFLLNTITPDNFMVFCCHGIKLFCLNTSTHIHFIYNYFIYATHILSFNNQWFYF